MHVETHKKDVFNFNLAVEPLVEHVCQLLILALHVHDTVSMLHIVSNSAVIFGVL